VKQEELSPGLVVTTVGKKDARAKDGMSYVMRFRDREYQFYGKSIISDKQAEHIFEKLNNESKDPFQSQRTLTQWKDDETHLFQYALFAYMVKQDRCVEDFTMADWEQVANIVPTKDSKKCQKRWLFIQKLGGNKTKWTKVEDQVLGRLVGEHGAKEWSKISEQLNETMQKSPNGEEFVTIRNGKQCRERWLTALDPSINKARWGAAEDVEFLEKWLVYGNKWRDIATMINGRTESQVKNRFKLILRRE